MKSSFKNFLTEYYEYIDFGKLRTREEDPVTKVPEDETAINRTKLANDNKYDKAAKKEETGDTKDNYDLKTLIDYLQIAAAKN
jgi:hypothetical protein